MDSQTPSNNYPAVGYDKITTPKKVAENHQKSQKNSTKTLTVDRDLSDKFDMNAVENMEEEDHTRRPDSRKNSKVADAEVVAIEAAYRTPAKLGTVTTSAAGGEDIQMQAVSAFLLWDTFRLKLEF